MKAVLGLKLDPWHDTGAAIVIDDGVRLRVIAISQERLDRVKHSRAFPAQAIDYCLETAGCRLSDLSLVVSDFIMTPTVDDRATGAGQPVPYAKQAFFREINNLGIPTVFMEHHACHAASAYYATDWDDATALVIDGHGSHYETQSIFCCRGNGITKVATSRRPGIGWMYNAVTELLLGFQHLQEGKTMGLAGYATDGGSRAEDFTGIMDANNPCQIVYPQFAEEGPLWKLTVPDLLSRRKKTDDLVGSPFAQYAFAAQSSLNSGVMHLVRAAARVLPSKRLCYSGGVALNIIANRLILDSGLYDELFIQPAASDTGIPLGAALLGYYSVLGGTLRWNMHHAFLGKEYDSSRTNSALSTWKGPGGNYNSENVAKLLANDYLIAWVQGASEYGPRALGHRSILCLPHDPQMKAYLNREVKHREMFRPFAPIVPIENQAAYFDLSAPSPFMLINARVNPAKAAAIPAVVHADGTARVQSIRENEQPELHALLQKVGAVTGIPVLLNTSLNLAGEPIVETPAEAVDLFSRSRLDALVLGDRLLTKKPLLEMLTKRNPGISEMHATKDTISVEQIHTTSVENAPAHVNILFYVEPLVDAQKDGFIRGSHYIITNFINTLKKNKQVHWDALILANASVQENFGAAYKQYFKEVPENLFLDFYKETDRYEIIAKSFRGEHDKEALVYFAKAFHAMLGDFKPDVIVSSVPVPFLKELFPQVLTLHVEAGLFIMPQYSMSLLFDPIGLLNNSFIDQFAKIILDSTLSEKQNNALQRLKQTFCKMIEARNPFHENLEKLKKKYKKLVLVSLPFIRDLQNDSGIASFTTVEELLFALLGKIDDTVGVLLTTHPAEKLMNSDLLEKVQCAFPNVTYIERKQHYFTSLHVMPFVDAVINISSKTALWSLFWGKKLLNIGKTFSAISDWPDIDSFNIEKNLESVNKDSFLYYVLTKYYVPEKYYTDNDWLSTFLINSIHKNKGGQIDLDFYSVSDTDTTIIEDLIQQIEGIQMNEKTASTPGEKIGLEFTGERFVPELDGQLAYEHFHRYAFASELAKGKNVLDIASGEGYGSALLANIAREVVGIDISEEAINHAKKKYAGTKNLSFHLGECKNIPCQDGYFDLVVSFETLEHTAEQEAFLVEIKRVLKKDGILIISTPNKKIYSNDKCYDNPYHLLELNEEDFHALLSKHFTYARFWGQRLTFSSHMWPMDSQDPFLFKHYRLSPSQRYIEKNDPPFDAEYSIAVCSDNALMPDNHISLYTGLQNEQYADYFKKCEWGAGLAGEIESKNNLIADLQSRIELLKLSRAQHAEEHACKKEEQPSESAVRTKQAVAGFNADSQYVEAQALIQADRTDEALAVLIDIIHAQPEHARAHNALGLLYFRTQDKVRALMHYERSVSLDPENTYALRSLADFYYTEMGRVEESQQLYAKVISKQPDNIEALQILANICVSFKQLHVAQVLYAKILRLTPENADARYAVEAINKFLQHAITQESPELLYKEALLLSNAGLIDEALALHENLLESHPAFALCHNDLGVIWSSKGDFQKAQKHYQQALMLEPSNIMFAKNLADLTFIALGQTEEAIKMYSAIHELQPDEKETLVSLGQAYLQQRNAEKAAFYFRKILAIDPVNAYAKQGLRAFQLKVGLILATQDLGCFNTFPPLGLGYIAASVKNNISDVDVVIKEKLADLIQEKPDIIGISSSSDNYYKAIEFAKTIKQELNIPVVIGGIHISLLPESLQDCFDVAVIGEGEMTFVELLQTFRTSKSLDYEKLKEISGLVFMYNGELFRTKDREPIMDLDSLPQPVVEELPFYDPSNAVCLVSARGCPYKCSFCSSAKFAQSYRACSVDLVVDQIDYWVNKKNATNIVFYDDLLVASKKKLSELVTKLEERSIIGKCFFNCQVRANLVNDEICSLLKRLNVVEVGMGVESFCDKILRYYNKSGCTAAINQRAIDLLHSYGIKVGPGIILGAPMETKEDLLITLRAVFNNLKAGKIQKPGWGVLRPFPGTPMWDYAVEEGLVSPSMDWKEFTPSIYLCKAIPRTEFFEIIEEWITKYSILLLDKPGVGGNFVCTDIEKVWKNAKRIGKIIKERNASELGDDIIVNFLEKFTKPTFHTGCYADADGGHWLGKKATVMVKYAEQKDIIMHGYIPDVFFKDNYGQSLIVSVTRPDNTPIASKLIDATNCIHGDFTFHFSLPTSDFASITITSSKTVIPKSAGINADERELSFLMKDLCTYDAEECQLQTVS